MTLAEQLTQLKLQHGTTNLIVPDILLRVLDSLALQQLGQQHRIDELSKLLSHLIEQLSMKADRTPHTDPRG